MIPKLAIERAIEGGWCKNYGTGNPPHRWGFGRKAVTILYNQGGPIQTYYFAQVALDPSFWQSLGKALGWHETITNTDVCTDCLDKYKPVGWHRNARLFSDLILTGQPTDEYWKEILN